MPVSALGWLVTGGALGFVLLLVGSQWLVARRSQAMTGARLPPLAGALGEQVTKADHALLYFFSPSCGACRSLTPRVRALAAQRADVFTIDLAKDLEVARALGVMATPSTIEVERGTITGYHVGPIPDAVWKRFALENA